MAPHRNNPHFTVILALFTRRLLEKGRLEGLECEWGGEGCLRGKFLFCIRSFAPFLPPPFVQFYGERARRVFPLCHSQSSRTDERTFRLLLFHLEGERAIELHNGVKTRFSTSTRLHSTFAAIDGPGGRMRQAFPSFVTRLFGRAEVNLAARLNAEIRRC